MLNLIVVSGPCFNRFSYRKLEITAKVISLHIYDIIIAGLGCLSCGHSLLVEYLNKRLLALQLFPQYFLGVILLNFSHQRKTLKSLIINQKYVSRTITVLSQLFSFFLYTPLSLSLDRHITKHCFLYCLKKSVIFLIRDMYPYLTEFYCHCLEQSQNECIKRM